MSLWLADRDKHSTGKASRVWLPSSLTRRLGNAMRASQNSKRKKAKNRTDLSTWVLDTVDGRAQPDQYGGHHCRLGRGSARPSRCQAFLRDLPHSLSRAGCACVRAVAAMEVTSENAAARAFGPRVTRTACPCFTRTRVSRRDRNARACGHSSRCGALDCSSLRPAFQHADLFQPRPVKPPLRTRRPSR